MWVLFNSKRRKTPKELAFLHAYRLPSSYYISTLLQYVFVTEELINTTLSPAQCSFSTSIDRASGCTSSTTLRIGLYQSLDATNFYAAYHQHDINEKRNLIKKFLTGRQNLCLIFFIMDKNLILHILQKYK